MTTRWTRRRVVPLALLGLLVLAVSVDRLMQSQGAVLADGGVSLAIPSRYVLRHRFIWIDFAKGLDDSSRSINIVLPKDEATGLLPNHPEEITAVVALLSDRERDAIKSRDADEAAKIRETLQSSPATMHVEPDPTAGLYRVYADHRETAWTVIAGEPAEVTGDDVVGRCLELMDGKYRHCYIQLEVDGISVQYALDVRNLDRRQALASHFAALIHQWKGG